MKNIELSEESRDIVVDKYKSGEGYKSISKKLEIPVSTVRSIIKKWKTYGTTQTLPRSGRPPKLNNKTSRKLAQNAKQNPTMTLKDLQNSASKMGVSVHVTTISRSLNKAGLRKMPRMKKLSKKTVTNSLTVVTTHLDALNKSST